MMASRTTRATNLLAACALAGLAFGAGSAAAQDQRAVERAQAELAHEPSAAQTAARALRYFRVTPGALDGLRSAARARGLLPVIAGGYRYSTNQLQRVEQIRVTSPQDIDENQLTGQHEAVAGALWDLRQLAFNPAEVQVYGIVAVQRDLLLEVTRAYFLRRQLQLRLRLRPPTDPLAYAALELRIAEFTSLLDVMTGGWFSEAAEERRSAR